MTGFLSGLLCWVQQVGAMVLNSLIDIVNLFVTVTGGLVTDAIASWPVGMPSLPAMPDGVLLALGWVEWSPFPLAALGAFVAFIVSVWFAVWALGPVLRYLKVLG